MTTQTPTTHARHKFRVGDRVSMTHEAKRQLGMRRHYSEDRVTVGTVVGFCRGDALVRVLRDGYARRETYHLKFWEAVEDG